MRQFSALVLVLLLIIFVKPAYGAISSCAVSVDKSILTPSSTDTFSFSVTNSDASTTAKWIKIIRPSSNFTINSYSITDRTVSLNSNDVTITGGDLPAGFVTNLIINVTAGSSELSSDNWIVQISDDEGGADAVNCSGSLSTSISSTPDTTAPVLSSLTVSDVTDSSVKITWTTDLSSDSSVDYGTSDAYGSSATGDASATSHSVSISSLSANTTYHYNAKSANSGGTTTSGDNTFVTAKTGMTGTTTTGTTTTTTTTIRVNVTPTPKPTPAPDKIAPVISLDTSFDKPFKESPKITGKATDADSGGVGGGVSSVDYSIDDGKNWLPVDEGENGKGKGGSTNFNFTPAIFEDGNYQIKVRAKDPSGNIGYSSVKTMVIDRLPPQVGGVMFSIGPQILSPNKDGIIYTLEGLSQKITLSAVGGPTGIVIKGEGESGKGEASLTKNLDNGLWSSDLTFDKEGTYQLLAKSVDGANNKTERNLNKVVVLNSGIVKNTEGKAIANAEIKLFYFEPTLGQFSVWDGKSFGQSNPQKTDQQGKYGLIIPPGKYYLQIDAPGYKTLKSNIFTLEATTPLNADFTLSTFKGIQIGPFKIAFFGEKTSEEVKLNLPSLPAIEAQNPMVQEFPYFPSTNTLKGKPTLITFLSIWSPQTFEQLPYLNDLSDKKEVNGLVIMSQTSVSKTEIFRKIGGYKVPIVADPDGVLVIPLNIINLPTHVFLDRKGIIRKIKVGVLNKEELLDNLVN